MKYNLFCVNTEYHFLLSLSIVHERFFDNGYKNIFLLLEGTTGRLNNIMDSGQYPFLEIIRITESQPDLKAVLNTIAKQEYSYLFHFYEFNVITAYLRTRINKSCIKVYGEDGTAIYQRYDKLALGSRTRQTINDYKKAFKLNIVSAGIRFQNLVHGQSGYIDELWLTHPELYLSLYKTKKRVEKINLLATPEMLQFAKSFFSKTRSDIQYDNTVFFLGRTSYSPEYLTEEVKLIRELRDKFADKAFYIKIHPLTKAAQKEEYSNIEGIEIITENLPAEILLAQLTNAVIIGVDSTALFYKNEDCTNYALYKYLQEKGVYPSYREIPFPSHVQFYNDSIIG